MFGPMQRRILIVLACFGTVVLLTNLALVTATDFGLRIEKLQLPVVLGGRPSLGPGENVGYGGFIFILDLQQYRIHGGPDNHDNRMQVFMGFSRRRDPGEGSHGFGDYRGLSWTIVEFTITDQSRLHGTDPFRTLN